LNYIGGDLVVLNNSSLKSLKGLDNVGDTIGNIFINGNYLIDGISSLNRLKHIKNRLVLYLLESRIINGFKNLRSVGEAIDILAGEKMYDLDAFYVLDTIFSSSFDPEVNSTSLGITVHGIKNLDEFNNLRFVKGILLSGNRKLEDISGFDNIDTSVLKDLQFLYNDGLILCNSKMVCQYLSDETHASYFYKNAPGCNTREEILASCTTATNEWYTASTAAGVFPNPCPLNSSLWFTGQEADFHLTLYTSTGQKAFEGTVSNPVNLPVNCTGLYHYRLTSAGKQKSGAVVVME